MGAQAALAWLLVLVRLGLQPVLISINISRCKNKFGQTSSLE